MKKFKVLSIILVLISILGIFCLNYKVIAGEVPQNAGDMARTAGSDEPTPTSDGIDLINDVEGGSEGENNNTTPVDNHENHEIRQGDLYVAAGNKDYVMDQMVDGNVYIFGKNVKVTGQINGSLFVCASGKLEIDNEAYIACHMFAFADDIVINGMILDVYTASNSIELGENTLVYRQIKSFARSAKLAGAIGRDAEFIADTIEISGNEEGLKVYGDLKYEAKNEIANIDKATIEGDVVFKKSNEKEEDTADIVLDYVFSAIGTIVFDIVIYICLIFLAPNFIQKSKDYVSTKGLIAFAIGLAFTIIVPVIIFVLLLTGVLASLGVLAGFIYAMVLMVNAFVFVMISNEFASSKLGLGEDKFKKGLLLIPVSLLVWAIRKLPIIGSWISIIVFLCGVGVLILYQFDRRKKNN